MTEAEIAEMHRLQAKSTQEAAEVAQAELDRRHAGYRWWCSEGCGFVKNSTHRCEQWGQVVGISPAMWKAIREAPE